MAGPGLRPKVKIVCPLCDERLTFTCFLQEGSSVNWVLSPSSYKHLGSCNGRREEKASGTGNEEGRGYVRSAPDPGEGTARDQGPLRLAELQVA